MKLKTVWDDRYCSNASGSILSTRKQIAVVAGALAEGLLDIVTPDVDVASAWRMIAEGHEPSYVNAVRTGTPILLAESQGFNWSPQFADAVAHIYVGQLMACELAKTAGIVFHPISGAHHAFYERGS
jgi:acetoin utilization deacetylase AcuC-like enzyme